MGISWCRLEISGLRVQPGRTTRIWPNQHMRHFLGTAGDGIHLLSLLVLSRGCWNEPNSSLKETSGWMAFLGVMSFLFLTQVIKASVLLKSTPALRTRNLMLESGLRSTNLKMQNTHGKRSQKLAGPNAVASNCGFAHVSPFNQPLKSAFNDVVWWFGASGVVSHLPSTKTRGSIPNPNQSEPIERNLRKGTGKTRHSNWLVFFVELIP